MGIIMDQPEWDLYGTERRNRFEKDLEPQNLAYDLKAYRNALGPDFGVKELLQLQEIRAKGFIAQAITDFPELLIEQIGKGRQFPQFHSIGGALEDIAETFLNYVDNMPDSEGSSS